MSREVRRIMGNISPFLLDPLEYGDAYMGALEQVPNVLNSLLIKQFIGVSSLKAGYNVTIRTSDSGQYEIFAYPKTFGELTSISQNNISINSLGAWKVKEITQDDVEYYVYYTEYKQYGDLSTFIFKI